MIDIKEHRIQFKVLLLFNILQNGYQEKTKYQQYQKRNIVDDAKFETKVNEEEKRNWINQVRRKSQGM